MQLRHLNFENEQRRPSLKQPRLQDRRVRRVIAGRGRVDLQRREARFIRQGKGAARRGIQSGWGGRGRGSENNKRALRADAIFSQRDSESDGSTWGHQAWSEPCRGEAVSHAHASGRG